MAEHLSQAFEPPMNAFNAMGQPISTSVRQAAYNVCRNSFGLDSAQSWEVVNTTAEQLERDQPHTALGQAMKHLDLTSAYRLMAELLAGADQERQQAQDQSSGSMVDPSMALPSKTLAEHQTDAGGQIKRRLRAPLAQFVSWLSRPPKPETQEEWEKRQW